MREGEAMGAQLSLTTAAMSWTSRLNLGRVAHRSSRHWTAESCAVTAGSSRSIPQRAMISSGLSSPGAAWHQLSGIPCTGQVRHQMFAHARLNARGRPRRSSAAQQQAQKARR
ncbi:hypothetical protein VI08_13675 [Luteibacter yeojuensis]|uniref:Uncharacterized protein n=1 Tax=Luteibacter yeojuensis TaxID=345309 RepID=A0A0F3KMF9_9GAMM|nr:hypothetical protein VI08_13675 [Luteibacter yeojuensis]